MRVYSAQETAEALPFKAMIDGIQALFAAQTTAPLRHHHSMQTPDGDTNTLLLMPAWQGQNGFGGVKIVNVTPANAERGLPSIAGSYLLFDELTGEHLALFDGSVLTSRRTAAASALGARYLANPQARTLLIVGAGKVARQLPEAFACLFPLEQILVWNRNPEHARDLVNELNGLQRWETKLCTDLATEMEQADIISCATLTREPLIQGEWLQAGQHLDLVGSFTPHMREADDEAMRIAQVYIDTEAALKESGDLLQPLQSGALKLSNIRGTLYDLCAQATQRYDPEVITLFKGVGHAVEDLACAMVGYEAMD